MLTSTMATISLSTATTTPPFPKPNLPNPLPSKPNTVSFSGLSTRSHRRLVLAMSSPSTPPEIGSKVTESIKQAEETCAGDPQGGECAAAWDEVEELSAAASHARDKQKDADPLETYCKDNPETDECRTYDN